ncbi:MAG: hypothetical protein IJD95_04865 [Clostridia bacterium]|nr:hypothetical protein [Clostridia bacterium]
MIDKLIIILYLVTIAAVGIAESRRTKEASSFFSSSGKKGLFVSVAVLSSGFIGGGYSVGNAAESYRFGLPYSIALCGFSVGIILFALFVLPKIKISNEINTAGELLRSCYGSAAKRFGGFFSFIFCLGIASAQLSTLRIIISELFEINGNVGLIIAAAIILIYSTAGGMNAVVKTDGIQFTVLIIGLPLLLFFAIKELGDPSQLYEIKTAESINILQFGSLALSFATGELITPQLIQRLRLSKTRKILSQSLIISAIISAVIFIITGAVGVAANVIFTDVAPQNIVVAVASRLIPKGIKGVVGASLCAVLITSADSAINSASASLSSDILGKSDIKTIRIINVLTGIISVFAVIAVPDVMELLMISYKFWCPVMFSQLLYALMGKKGSKSLFLIPAAVGMASVAIWDIVLKAPCGISSVAVGFTVNVISFIITKRLLRESRSL